MYIMPMPFLLMGSRATSRNRSTSTTSLETGNLTVVVSAEGKELVGERIGHQEQLGGEGVV